MKHFFTLLLVVIFFGACVFDLDPTKPPLKKTTFTFQKFTIRDGSKTITKTQILANIVGKKKNFRIKKIKINHSEIAKIIGEQPNFQIQILKTGNFTANIILEKEGFLDVKIENCAFEIQNKNVSFQKLTRILKDGNTITTTQILQQIRGLSGLKYQIKSIAIPENKKEFAKIIGEKPNFEIQILKIGKFTAEIILEKTGFLDVKIENCVFEIQNKNVSFQKLTRLLKDGNTITTTQILQQIRGLSGLKYQIKSIAISDTSFANVVGEKPNFQIQILKTGKFTANIILEKTGFLDVEIENCAFEKIASNIYFEKFTITNGSRMIMKDQILAKIQGQKTGYQIKNIAISDASFANVGANFEIQILKTGTFTAEIILEKTGFLDVKIENCAFEIQNKTFTFQKLIIRNGNKTITKNEILAKIQGQKTGYQIKNIAISDASFANVGANFEIQILKTGNFTAEIILEKTGFLDVKIENCEFQVIPASINVFPITDPRYKDQWYLKNTTGNLDINIEPVWRKGYTGRGMKIGILDDVVNGNHPDLKDNVYFVKDYVKRGYDHGTNVAGIIAARDNNIGIRGIAFRATLYSYGVLANPMDLALVRRVFEKDMREIAVYNNSWGEDKYLSEETIRTLDKLLKDGFGGKGCSIVHAVGNSGIFAGTQSEFQEYYGSITVGFVYRDGTVKTITSDMHGAFGPRFAPSILISGIAPDVLTTSGSNGYRGMSGTSSTAPQVSGVVALMREANPNLGWRDVRIILAECARPVLANFRGKSTYKNAGKRYTDPNAYYQHSFYAGFGLLDAAKAVELAENWTPITAPLRLISRSQQHTPFTATHSAFASSTLNIPQEMDFVEAASLHIKLSERHVPDKKMGFATIELIAPDGRVAEIVTHRQFHKWGNNLELKTVAHMFFGRGQIKGDWRLRIKTLEQGVTLKVKHWGLEIRGH